MAYIAGTVVNNVRDLVPDPGSTYGDATTDGGLIRAATMYRWLDEGVRTAARALGLMIEDWTAIQQINTQPNYVVDSHFTKILDGVSNLWPLDTISLVESDVIWPSGKTLAQSLSGFYHLVGDHLEFGLWPVPNASDPTTTLSGNITASVATFAVASVTSFLAYGYIQIGSEIMRYESLTGTTLNLVTRGVGGTTAATHTLGDTVTHLGLWLKGLRVPATISASTSTVELPLDVVTVVQDYMMAMCRMAENEHEVSAQHMKRFTDWCAAVRADPKRAPVQQGVARGYDEYRPGPVYFPRMAGGVIFR